MFGAKGKGGKDYGKGAGKEGGSKGKGHTLDRTRLSAEKFAGTVDAWKGKYGWIKPAEEIAHEKAAERNGNVFVALGDLQGALQLEYGAPVKFHIFEDAQGLGAEEVEELGPGTPGGDPKGKGSSKGFKGKDAGKFGGCKGGFSAPSYDKGGWGGNFGKGSFGGASAWGGKADAGWGAPAWGGKGGAKAGGWGVQNGFSKGADFSKGAKGGKGDFGGKKGGKDGNKGKGHLLERTRITAEKFAGTVNVWKGKYGFIAPAEEIAHEKASKHNGALFVSINDLQDGMTELTVGQSVAFHIFEDPSGLGAEEVSMS